MATQVLMPRQGQSVESCIINEWLVEEGDTVTEGQPICDIETDKAAFEVEAPASGTVLGIFYPVDADVEVLKIIAVIGEPGEDISTLRPSGPAEAPAESGDGDQAGEASAEPAGEVRTGGSGDQPTAKGASPRAMKLAAEKGIDISGVAGTGPHGRVIERDVLAAQQGAVSPAGRASGEFPGNTQEIPVKGVRKLVAERMHASLQNSAQLTHHASADARALLAYRARCKDAPTGDGVGGISINDIVMYATVQTLAEYPELNAHCLGDRIVRFENVHLGMAVDTERGLVVPVIRNADLLDLRQLSAEAKRLAMACIEGQVDPDDLQGGTFTVTNLGALGIEAFTPVLNVPEVGILGVCAIQPKAVVNGAEVDFVPHIGLSLTFDHRAVDGAPAARFLASLRENLAGFEARLER
jgi:pyruvate dehydrogenase E2 component (dihydrolipoamide acetyltransferase)